MLAVVMVLSARKGVQGLKAMLAIAAVTSFAEGQEHFAVEVMWASAVGESFAAEESLAAEEGFAAEEIAGS